MTKPPANSHGSQRLSYTSVADKPAARGDKPKAKVGQKPKGQLRPKLPGEVRIIGGLFKRTKLPVANKPAATKGGGKKNTTASKQLTKRKPR